MSKKLALAILLSGNGTNFQAIVDSIENGRLKAAIKIVISNKKDAFGFPTVAYPVDEYIYLGSFTMDRIVRFKQ